ncbi:MAG: hypothetical protein ACM33T_09510 [Solirubrobacterales bacterium]
MLFGRILGWLLIGLAAIMASADAVLALGPEEYAGIITADVVTLLTGDPYAGEVGWPLLARIERALLHLPAWTVVMAMGVTSLIAFRKRTRRFRFRRA